MVSARKNQHNVRVINRTSTDYLHNATSGETISANAWPEVFHEPDIEYHSPCKVGASHHQLLRKPVFSANVTLPTLLTNHSLDVHVEKDKYHIPIPGHKKDIYITKLFVNNQSITVADVVSRNGAVHVINTVLNPRPHSPHLKQDQGVHGAVDEQENGEWDDWENWLLRWAEEN